MRGSGLVAGLLWLVLATGCGDVITYNQAAPDQGAPDADQGVGSPGPLGAGGDSCPTGDLGCACYPNSTCNQLSDGDWLFCGGGICVEATCSTGNLGCGCLPDASCSDDLVCDTSDTGPPICQPSDCARGDEGCACASDRTCNAPGLACVANVCEPITCGAGRIGAVDCPCASDFACDIGLRCVEDGYCQPLPCPPGELGCPCSTPCTGDLVCDAEDFTCQDPDCPAGTFGCGCFGDYTCDPSEEPALTCNRGECVLRDADRLGNTGSACFPNDSCSYGNRCLDGVCVACAPGTLACSCFAGGTCGSELECIANTCVAERSPSEDTSREPPRDPVCYVPCDEGLTTAGGYHACDAWGLMAYCPGDLECTDGSCVQPGADPRTCDDDADCPDFQTCYASVGRCYSDCELSDDCPVGYDCYRHVCRAPCSTGGRDCGRGNYCEAVDGENGYCMPLAAPTGEDTEVPGDFTLDRYNVTIRGRVDDRVDPDIELPGITVVITNNAPRRMLFEVRRVDQTVLDGDDMVVSTVDPLDWLHLGVDPADPAPDGPGSFTIPGTEDTEPNEVVLRIEAVANDEYPWWQGTLEIVQEDLGSQLLTLEYVSAPDGQWVGNMYFFSDFPTGPGFDAWLAGADRNDSRALSRVENAFVQRWGAFRRGFIDLDNLQAMITATVEGTWDLASTRNAATNGDCDEPFACYLIGWGNGYAQYTSVPEVRVPQGVSELPIALNLRASDGDPTSFAGRIESTLALQYSGFPAVEITFAGEPTSPDCDSGACLVFVESLEATSVVGGRYPTTLRDGCPGDDYTLAAIPWLLDDFVAGTEIDEGDARVRYECRSNGVPFAGDSVASASLAQSNPLPNGRSLTRQLELVDGALVNQDTLIVLFRETFESFLGEDAEPLSSYGLMYLQRGEATLQGDAYLGNDAPLDGGIDDLPSSIVCDPDLYEDLLGEIDWERDARDAADLVDLLIDGLVPGSTPSVLAGDSGAERPHYLCVDTGLFDGGPDPQSPVPCPEASEVVYFTLTAAAGDDAEVVHDLSDEPCMDDFDEHIVVDCSDRGADWCVEGDAGEAGTCQATLARWRANGTYDIRLDPIYRCANGGVFCNADRLDLLAGKEFFARGQSVVGFSPIYTAIEAAFRYKTRFTTRSGSSVGFAPEVCAPFGSTTRPYCYEPEEIEDVLGRVDCLIAVYDHYVNQPSARELASTTLERLRDFLQGSFGDLSGLGDTLRIEGFERLNAELLVMMGDEAYTQAFASRFDLAGSRGSAFAGSRFEVGGIDLSGGVGYEMASLYTAAQYYQLVLDRFFALGPYLGREIRRQATEGNLAGFVQQEIVTAYFSRVFRAASQLARTQGAIAARYQSFNRPEIARRVVERAYQNTYLQLVILSNTLLELGQSLAPSQVDQIRIELELAQLRFRAELRNLRNRYSTISDELNYFGFAPDYIPFPALDPAEPNAFEVLFARARQAAGVAATDEERALASDRAFDTDSAAFQSELARIRQGYDNQLGDLCGTFVGVDGRIYPAVNRYIPQHPEAADVTQFGNICGMPVNEGRASGALYNARAGLDQARLSFETTVQEQRNLEAAIDLEIDRINRLCELTIDRADYRFEREGEIATLEDQIVAGQRAISVVNHMMSSALSVLELAKCGGTDCPAAAAAAFGSVYVRSIGFAAEQGIQSQIDATRREIGVLQRESILIEADFACDELRINGESGIRTRMLDLATNRLSILQAANGIELSLSEILRLETEARRILDEQAETESLAIDLEAARNDPNTRIYRNDAVLNADRTFGIALREAYRATRVFEYYTSQSYAPREELGLVRMIAHGDYSLNAYLDALDEAFFSFEESYGRPDTRVAILSLRDDILGIPRFDETTGEPLGQAERVTKLREALADPSRLDDRGYLTIPFATRIEALSPLTNNHKILYVEAEIVGSDIGDTLGRVYLRQAGTSMVEPVDGFARYYAFPERVAVIDAFFNGARVFDPSIYRSDRHRDRPYVNTRWELVLNQRDEDVNRDINLASLTDIRLYFYYTDFTDL